MADERQKVIEQYLGTHFADAKISLVRSEDNDAFLCRIEDGADEYQLMVVDEALSGEPQEMLAQLERYAPANVLREVIGFSVTVTTNGCIVGC